MHSPSYPLHLAHLVYRLDHGGLETILIQLVNTLPPERYRHSVICLTACGGGSHKITQAGVDCYDLDKQPGQDPAVWWRLWRLLRRLRPHILHTCNLAASEGLPVAALAGVKGRVHVEHGRDSYDLYGTNWRYRWLRRMTTLAAQRVVAVSTELQEWLIHTVGIPKAKVRLLVNGVDTQVFSPATGARKAGPWRVGFVGRVWPVKDPATLVQSVALWRQNHPAADFILEVVGDGPLRGEMETLAQQLGVSHLIHWLGWRDDVADCLRGWDLLVLPSLAEGTPLTILEAMACGLPVVASRVGGVPMVVEHGETGLLIPPGDAAALAAAMAFYDNQRAVAKRHGDAGRKKVLESYALQGMVSTYDQLFREVWAESGGRQW